MTPEVLQTVVSALHEKRIDLDRGRRYYSQGCGADHPAVADLVVRMKHIDDALVELEAQAVPR